MQLRNREPFALLCRPFRAKMASARVACRSEVGSGMTRRQLITASLQPHVSNSTAESASICTTAATLRPGMEVSNGE